MKDLKKKFKNSNKKSALSIFKSWCIKIDKASTIKKYSVTFFNGKFNDINVPFMIDSGSNYSLICKSFLDILKTQIANIHIFKNCCNVILSCGIDCPINVLGCTTLFINVNNVKLTQNFIVVDNLSVPCLLGLNFLIKNQCLIDYKNNKIIIQNKHCLKIYGIYLNYYNNSISKVNLTTNFSVQII